MPNQTPTSTTEPDTSLYKLIAEKLGRDPLELICERRQETPPVPYTKIRDELVKATGTYLTHEAPRRWYRQHMLAKARQEQEASAA